MKLFLNESDEFDFPLEDGTSEEFLDGLHKQKEENEKELNKYIDDAEKIIDDVNKSDEKIYVKQLKEKLILEEQELNEAIPFPLAQAMKNSDTSHVKPKGEYDRTPPYYGRIKPTYGSGYSKPDIDFEKSTYTEITPDEAIQYKKDGRIQDLLIVYGGRLISFRENGKQLYRAERRGDDYQKYPNLFKRPNGDIVDSTSKLTFNTIATTADHIYLKDEVSYNADDYYDRGGDYTSPRFSSRMTNKAPAVNYNSGYWNQKGSYVRGGTDNPAIDSRIKDYKNSIKIAEINIEKANENIKNSKDRINEIKSSLSEKNADDLTEEELNNLIDSAKRDIERLKSNIGWQQRNISDYEQSIINYKARIKSRRAELKDARARYRYANSEADLTKCYGEFAEVKNKLKNLERNIKEYEEKKAEIKASGTPESRQLRRRIDEYKAYIADYESRIADMESRLANISDSEEIKELEDQITSAKTGLTDAETKFNKMLGRKNESLTEALDTLTDDGDYKGLKLDGHLAQKIYALITGSEKLDELYRVIDELFPEGITQTGLQDIFNYDPYFILNELDIEIPDDLIKNLEPDEEESDYEEEEIESDESEEEPVEETEEPAEEDEEE